ncbi:MAG: penicillin amidase [Acidobacteriota bacterium]|jgi:penicillin amidase|nr:penicillin amidase [Acidobacteriota bacterium]
MKKTLSAFCLLLILSLFLPVLPLARVSAQANSQTLSLAGLREKVTVRRDERGIPYIEAANESDLYFAQGYVTATDRLFQMELFRRAARGELSEIFGNTTLDEDKRHRTLGFARLAESQVATLPARLRRALEDYARGVNAYIESLDAKELPPEFQILRLKPRPWLVSDSLAASKLLDESLSTTWRLDLTRSLFASLSPTLRDALFPETSPLDVILVGSDHPGTKRKAASTTSVTQESSSARAEMIRLIRQDEILMRRSLERLGLFAQDNAASNNWVVSGKRTVTGQPLLANDPHLSPSAPSIWHMAHLSMPGHRVAGVSVAGLPGIAIGHNEHIAWGVTSLEPDVQDLYIERFDKDNPHRYMTPAGWKEADVRHEEIKVRESLVSTNVETVPYEVTVTRHGPVILKYGGNRYALRWTALDPQANLADSFYMVNFARNWNDFRAAFRNYSGPAFNMIYADTKGHIGYYGTGRFPIRKTGDGKLPYDGATDEGEWTGFIPFDALPHVYDPPGGIIVTANSRIVGLDYPYKLTVSPLAAYRARRIYDLLQAKKKFSIEDFRAIQKDTYGYSGVLFAREVAQVTREDTSPATKDEKWQAAVRLMSEWDGNVVPESRAALLIFHMRTAFRDRMLIEAVGTDLASRYNYANADTLIDRLITERPPNWLPKEFKSYAELLRACYMDAHEALAKRFGEDESTWTWGRAFLVRFPHPLAIVPRAGQQFIIPEFPQQGSLSGFPTVNRGANVSMRLIADVSNWDHTQQGIPLGVSGNPSSPHWKDQLEDWRGVTPRAFPFTPAAVIRAARETLVLEPKTK